MKTTREARRRIPIIPAAGCLLLVLAVSAVAHPAAYRFVTKWGSYGSADGEFWGPCGVDVDASGIVYVVECLNDRIQKFDSHGSFRTKWGSYGSGNGQFRGPTDVAVDASGNAYVSDSGGDRIQKFSAGGAFRGKWGTTGDGDGQFDGPDSLDVDPSGNVYVVDAGNDRIQKFSPAGVFLAKWGSEGTADGQFDGPTGVAVDAAGNVYVADARNFRVQRFTADGVFVTKWGSKGAGDGQFFWMGDLAVGTCGSVYVADTDNNRIQKFTSAGVFLTKWGSEGTGDARLWWPADVAFDASGNAYVAEYLNHRMQKFAPGPSLEWAGISGYMHDGVKPNSGPSGTAFNFKVRYTDPQGAAPLKARCLICRRAGPSWELYQNLHMTRGSGDLETGAVYKATTTLHNRVWRHKFHFQAADGSWVDYDPPAQWQQGPEITAAPRLHWCGKTGYTADGVHPNSGPIGTRFTFKVMYQDSDNQPPDTHQLSLRRNGNPYKVKTMTEGGGAGYRLGRIYATSVTLTKSGTYTYRFRFSEGGKQAKGTPTGWKSGPNITESGALILTGLSSVPTNAGAQVSFTLSASADVTATVLNVAGRPIRTVAIDRPLHAGVQTLLWDRESETGLAVPAGLYIVRIAARGDDGGQSAAVATLTVR